MAGGYDPLNPPKRAGFYSRIIAAAEAMALGGNGGVVAVLATSNWGPDGTSRYVNQRDFEAAFGTTADDDHFAVAGALTGSGEDGDGASEVVVQRVAGTGAAAAERDFVNTAGVPAPGVNVAAKYKGTLGNSITVTFRNHPSEGGVDQMLVYLDGALRETYDYAETDLADLAAQVAAKSALVIVTVLVNGVSIAAATSQGLTDTVGANGTVDTTAYSNALSALEAISFNILVAPNMTDAPTLAAIRAWTATMNATARRVMLVTGGAADETFTAAMTRTGLSSSTGDVVNLGYNMFTDPNGVVRSSAQMAGYVAGMIAGAGAKRSITFARLPEGFDLTVAPTFDEIVSAIDGGLLVFSKDARGVRVERGVTTFTDTSDPDMPHDVFSKIQQVRTIHMIENDLTEATEGDWIGKVQNTDKSRDAYVGMLLAYFRRLENENILKPGSRVRLDLSQDNTGDTLYPIYSIEMASAIERVLALGEVAA